MENLIANVPRPTQFTELISLEVNALRTHSKFQILWFHLITKKEEQKRKWQHSESR